MNVEDTVRNCIANYPSLFTHRAQVLEQLFFVNGNGYEWVKGELVNCCHTNPSHSPFWDENPPERPDFPLMREIQIRVAQEQNARSRRILSEIDQRCQSLGVWALESVYPICEYAEVMNIPDDVQPDWLAAAGEAVALAQGVPSYTDYPPDYNQKWLDQAGERISQLQLKGDSMARCEHKTLRDARCKNRTKVGNACLTHLRRIIRKVKFARLSGRKDN